MIILALASAIAIPIGAQQAQPDTSSQTERSSR